MHNRMMDVDEYLRTSFEDAGALTETLRTENPTIENSARPGARHQFLEPAPQSIMDI